MSQEPFCPKNRVKIPSAKKQNNIAAATVSKAIGTLSQRYQIHFDVCTNCLVQPFSLTPA